MLLLYCVDGSYSAIGRRSGMFTKRMLEEHPGLKIRNHIGGILDWTHAGGEFMDPQSREQTNKVHPGGVYHLPSIAIKPDLQVVLPIWWNSLGSWCTSLHWRPTHPDHHSLWKVRFLVSMNSIAFVKWSHRRPRHVITFLIKETRDARVRTCLHCCVFSVYYCCRECFSCAKAGDVNRETDSGINKATVSAVSSWQSYSLDTDITRTIQTLCTWTELWLRFNEPPLRALDST